jgi:3-isopropylmalate dehydrogenase
MIESTRMLIEWLGRKRNLPSAVAASDLMLTGIQAMLADPASRTGDINGTGKTADMVASIIRNMA